MIGSSRDHSVSGNRCDLWTWLKLCVGLRWKMWDISANNPHQIFVDLVRAFFSSDETFPFWIWTGVRCWICVFFRWWRCCVVVAAVRHADSRKSNCFDAAIGSTLNLVTARIFPRRKRILRGDAQCTLHTNVLCVLCASQFLRHVNSLFAPYRHVKKNLRFYFLSLLTIIAS